MYIPKYFQSYELVPKDIYYKFFDIETKRFDPNFWFLFDLHVLITADRLRERWGKIIINTWYWGGKNQYRGLRPPGIDVGAEWSQHKFGRALDCIFIEADVEEVRRQILANPFDRKYQYITAMELNIGWLHFDTRNWNKRGKGIFTF